MTHVCTLTLTNWDNGSPPVALNAVSRSIMSESDETRDEFVQRMTDLCLEYRALTKRVHGTAGRQTINWSFSEVMTDYELETLKLVLTKQNQGV